MAKQGNTGRPVRTSRKDSAAAVSLLPGSQVVDPAPRVIDTVASPPEEGEDAIEIDDSPLDETTLANVRPNPNMPAWSQPGQLAVEQPKRVVSLPTEQDFTGQYVALARLNLDDRDPAQAGSIVLLTDSEARHFLKAGAVRSAAEHTANGGLTGLPASQSFAGIYTALARLNLESGERVDPGSRVSLSDSEARHFLKSGAIKSATGLRI